MKYIHLFVLFVLFGFIPLAIAADDAPLPEILQPKKAPTYDTRASLLNKQYGECQGAQVSYFDEANIELLCSCIVANTDQMFEREADLRSYVLRGDGWIVLKDKVLVHAYPDCMAAATKRLTQDECLINFKVVPEFKKSGAICECVGEGFEAFMVDRSFSFTARYLEENPKGLWPYNKFLSGHGIEVQNRYLIRSCIERHEYGWK